MTAEATGAGQTQNTGGAADPNPNPNPNPEGNPNPNGDGGAADPKPNGDGGGDEGDGKGKAKDEPPKDDKGSSGKGDGDGKPGDQQPPEKYELVHPEGSRLRDVDLEYVASEAKAIGLSQDAAQKLVNARAEQLAQTAQRYLDELKADPVMGGDKLDATLTLAVKGRDLMFPPGSEEASFINDLLESGVGNHKLLVRAFARIGKMASEDNPAQGGTALGGKTKKAPEEVLYGGE